MKEIILRTTAIEYGWPRYFTGRPCARSHIAERYTSSHNCVVCNQEAYRRWEKNNPGKALERLRRSRGMPVALHSCPAACEICGEAPKGGRPLMLDHCHKSNDFRGWLCTRCN